jgi:hypothetical protein
MSARTAEPVIQVEVPESGIQVIAPHQADHPTSEPDAFGVSGRAVNGLSGFHELGCLALAVACRGGRSFRCIGLLLLFRLILGAQISTLGDRGTNADQEGGARHRYAAHGHMPKGG